MKSQFENEAQFKLSRTGQFASIHKSMNIGSLVFIASLCVFSGAANAKLEVVTLTSKYIATGSNNTSGVTHFVAIPYAKPPTGDLRWRAPQKWDISSGTPTNPGNPAAVNFNPAGLGNGKIPQCMPGQGAVEGTTGNVSDGTALLPLWVPTNLSPLIYAPLTTVSSENCLYLNVYTKYANSTSARKPVFVWIHGGGNMFGTAMSNIYNPANGSSPVPSFMETVDAVVVTINYRLGPFGFLAHPSLTAEAGTSGTYGNLDQIMALQWVQDNIDKFGGNKDKVTIFGESAGALNTSILNASPLNSGLFSQTIQQSGYNLPVFWAANQAGVLHEKSSAFNKTVLTNSPFDATTGKPKWPTLTELEQIGTGLSAVLAAPCPKGVNSGQDKYDGLVIHNPWGACGYRSNMSMNDLRKLSPGIIGAAYSNSGMSNGKTPAGLGINVAAPPIDNILLTAQPVLSVKDANGMSKVKPSIIGSNRDEYTFLLRNFAPSINACVAKNVVGNCSENADGVNLLSTDGSGFKKIMQGIFGDKNGDIAFQSLPDQYKPKDYKNAGDVRDAVVSLLTDAVFTCHSRALIRNTAVQSAGKGNSYRYQMTYQPGLQEIATLVGAGYASELGYPFALRQMGAFHFLDVGYVFGIPPLGQFFFVNSPYPWNKDTQLAKTFQSAWGEFGLTGKVTQGSALSLSAGVEWTPYPYKKNYYPEDDPVFNFNNPNSVTTGTLSSASGNQFNTGKMDKSNCDWIDKFASP